MLSQTEMNCHTVVGFGLFIRFVDDTENVKKCQCSHFKLRSGDALGEGTKSGSVSIMLQLHL